MTVAYTDSSSSATSWSIWGSARMIHACWPARKHTRMTMSSSDRHCIFASSWSMSIYRYYITISSILDGGVDRYTRCPIGLSCRICDFPTNKCRNKNVCRGCNNTSSSPSFLPSHLLLIMSRPSTPPHQQTNGLYTAAHTPQTPVNHNFALTEYTANPTPPDKAVSNPAFAVPEAFLLPNGYPDVGHLRVCLFAQADNTNPYCSISASS
jgi:hypothetical protein